MNIFIVIFQGIIEIQGSPADLAQSGVNFAQLVGIDDEKELNEPTGKRCRKVSTVSTVSGESLKLELSENKDEEPKDEGIQMEKTSKGNVKGSVSVSYFNAGAHWSILLVLGVSFLIVQILASGSDYWVSVWYDNIDT